jgi:hypothetical protein
MTGKNTVTSGKTFSKTLRPALASPRTTKPVEDEGIERQAVM